MTEPCWTVLCLHGSGFLLGVSFLIQICFGDYMLYEKGLLLGETRFLIQFSYMGN